MLAFVAIVLAQTPTTANLPVRGFALDLLHPEFSGAGRSLASVAAYMSIRGVVGTTQVLFELPFAHQDTPFSGSSTIVGNPYVGAVFGGANGLGGAVGARLPVASLTDEATELGMLADASRVEAFRPATASIQGLVRYRRQTVEGFTVDVSGGPGFWFPTGEFGETEIAIHHQLSLGYQGSRLWVAAGISGLSLLSETLGGGTGGPGDETTLEFNASLGTTRGRTRPVIHLILPISNEYSSSVSYVIGLGVAFDTSRR